MKRLFLLILFLFVPYASFSGQANAPHPEQYAVAEIPTPVFNIPDFPFIFGGGDGKTLGLGKCRQVWNLEFIAMPNTVFRVEDTVKKGETVIYRVTTEEYPSNKGLFIDGRFVRISEDRPHERVRHLPSKKAVTETLLSANGQEYVWGGNSRNGVPEMLSFYPPSSNIDSESQKRWMLKGLDCSGLLYEATGGYTPRNTDALMDYGTIVHITGLNASQIIKKIKPLDLIVWKGHVIIILDRKRAIESRLDYDKEKPGCQGGVRIRPLKEVLEETLKNKTPVDEYNEVNGGKNKFIIRRWHP